MSEEDRQFEKSRFGVPWGQASKEIPKWEEESSDSPGSGSVASAMLEYDVARLPAEEGAAFNTIELGRGYPYVLFRPAGLQSNPADLYTLEAADGSYAKTLSASCARPGPFGFPVLWFPPPPEGPLYHLRFRTATDAVVPEYYIFRDQRLSLLDGGGAR